MISLSTSAQPTTDAAIILLTSTQQHPQLPKKLDKGDVFPVIHHKKTLVFIGLGEKNKLSLTELRIFTRKAFSSGFLKTAKHIHLIPHIQDEESIIAIIEGYCLGTYVWDKYKKKDANDTSIKNKKVTIQTSNNILLSQAIQICDGVNLTRDLVNENADVAMADFIEATVKGLIKGKAFIKTEILNRKELKAKGLNLHLAVNQGSNKEPKLIIVSYNGGKKGEPYTAFVGKGITFDTGGLNLKPSNSIETMKIDMAGAAAVCGVLKNSISLNIKKNLLFVLGIAENAIGPGAYKPGDVFTGYAGKSVEIGNTDAEGRLVLADALAYVVKNYKPKYIIDLATLTGACVVALGFDYTGLFSNSDALAADLIESSKHTDDRAWRLPIYPEMREYMKSPIADLKNTSSVKGAGASTAATFLSEFIGDTSWAHLDIAGTSFVEGSNRFYFNHGATGSGVRLLTHYLLNK